jgi:hypothetical protein
MTSTTIDAPKTVILTPTGDSKPVEKAVIDGIIANFDPETYLQIQFHKPNGNIQVWYAWTAGGDTLGDKVDRDALAHGFDAADWLHIPDRYRTEHVRGRVKTLAHPLRPIHADILNGRRADTDFRTKIRAFLDAMADMKNQPRPDIEDPDNIGPWLGIGPTMTRRREVAR